MRTFLLLLLLVSYSSLFSQNDDEQVYYLTRTMNLKEYDFTQVPPAISANTIVAQKGWRFTIDQPDPTGYIIKFSKWEDKKDPRNQTIYAEVTTSQVVTRGGGTVTEMKEDIKYYHILKKDFDDYVKEYVGKSPRYSFVTGAITIPIKIRPAGDNVNEEGNKLRPFDFTGDVNIGVSIGLRIRLDKKGLGYLIPSAGINLTSVSINENTVRNNIISSQTNASSLTPFIGLIGEYEGFQMALVTGWDRLSGNTGENWIYQGKPWFGIGLGYKIFNTNNKNPNNDSD